MYPCVCTCTLEVEARPLGEQPVAGLIDAFSALVGETALGPSSTGAEFVKAKPDCAVLLR